MGSMILVSVPDLFFSTRIVSTAQQLGVAVESCTPAELAERCKRERPSIAIVDLQVPPNLEAVRALRRDAVTREQRVVGFYAHVDHATRAAALEAGVDEVLPRSAFTTRLSLLLSGTPPT